MVWVRKSTYSNQDVKYFFILGLCFCFNNKKIILTEQQKRTKNNLSSDLVPKTGLEPVRYCYRRILSPVRLPVPPLRHIGGTTQIRTGA